MRAVLSPSREKGCPRWQLRQYVRLRWASYLGVAAEKIVAESGTINRLDRRMPARKQTSSRLPGRRFGISFLNRQERLYKVHSLRRNSRPPER